MIRNVKEKKSTKVFDGTKKLGVFMGAKESRRQPEKKSVRAHNALERAKKHETSKWAKPFLRGRKGQ